MEPTSPNEKPKTLRAAVYARTATDKKGPGSIEDQSGSCHQLCAERGWEIVETYSDAAMSGISPDRPAYNRLLLDAERGAFEILVIEGVDRLSRSVTQLSTLFERPAFRRIAVHTSDGREIAQFSDARDTNLSRCSRARRK